MSMTMPRMKNRAPMAFPNVRLVTLGLTGLALTMAICLQASASAEQAAPKVSPAAAAAPGPNHRQVLDRYCVTCHNQKLKTAGLMLDEADVANPGAGPVVWEK